MESLPANHVSYYDILQVSHSCSDSEIKQSYHRILLSLHPDKTKSQKQVDLSIYKEAYKVLNSDRRNYDKLLAEHSVNTGLADSSGLDHLDLSTFEEQFENGEYIWVNKCFRCEMGKHVITESQLEQVQITDAMGEVAVQCDNCSLWVSVGFKAQ